MNVHHGLLAISQRLKTVMSPQWIATALRDSFFNNSIYIMLSSLVSAALGLIFWIVAARTYSEEDIGIATAIIASATLIVTISRLGLDQSLIRFLPAGARSSIFTTVIVTTSVVSLVIGTVFVAGVEFFSPDLGVVKDMVLVFLTFIAISSMISIISNVFIAMRGAKYSLLQNVILGSRLVFILPLALLGIVGIITSFLIAYVLALVICAVILAKCGLRLEKMDRSFLKRSWDFSAGNYISVLLISIPTTVLPILVLNQLGSVDTAVYYIVFSLASILFMVPSACGTSLFVEGSHGGDMKAMARKSLIASYCILVPAIAAIFLLGDRLLGVVGPVYADHGFELLELMALSSFFVVLFQKDISVCQVRMNLRGLVILGLLNCVLLLSLSYALMEAMGLVGIGVAWIIGYGICAAVSWLLKRQYLPSGH